MSETRLIPLKDLGFGLGYDDDDARPLPFGTVPEDWRPLTAEEIAVLEAGGSRADDWSNVTVRDGFDPGRVEDCRFYGRVRIGALSPSFLEHHDLRLPVGLNSCTVVASDIGSDSALRNVDYMANIVVGERCILFNVNELVATDHAKFGNGVVMDGEDEDVRIWLEIANENGGRKVLPFDGMLPADAWIWSKYRDDAALMDRFAAMTGKIHGPKRGAPGTVGDGSVVKDCRILKDVRIGPAAYVKGANKLKNLTVNSDPERPTQIGEGCELVNGIIGFGCHVFYGVKAVRFVLGDHSSLKYGARLINSVLGPNSTVSCCELLNSLLFGSHEQHHNSSFLCASVLKGQSNMASAATVGSNHNSRAADGEIVAERGFWPGLTVSLKHNSRFAAFCLVAKGAYPAELDVPLPFCLVSNDAAADELILMPGYWFRYNMYALARNSAKTASRDKRTGKRQELEYDWLAPDTVDRMVEARRILEAWAEESEAVAEGRHPSGRALLESEIDPELSDGEPYRVEAGRRKVRVRHAGRAWKDYGRMIRYYLVRTFVGEAGDHEEAAAAFEAALEEASAAVGKGSGERDSGGTSVAAFPWINVGGQLIAAPDLEALKARIRSGAVADWTAVHDAYGDIGAVYRERKRSHALSVLGVCLREESLPRADDNAEAWLSEAAETAGFLLNGIRESRRKDYENPFRNTVYDNDAERDAVIGTFEENEFVKEAEATYGDFIDRIAPRK